MPNAGNLTDREAAIDAIVRFVVSLDSGDADMCTSSLTHDAIMDLTPLSNIGMQRGVVEGRDTVVNTLMTAVGKPLDTTHSATNIRCSVDGDSADLTCCVLAQHFRRGEGPKPEFREYYLMGIQYVATILRVEDLWRVSKLVLTPAWTVGNPDVMKV